MAALTNDKSIIYVLTIQKCKHMLSHYYYYYILNSYLLANVVFHAAADTQEILIQIMINCVDPRETSKWTGEQRRRRRQRDEATNYIDTRP